MIGKTSIELNIWENINDRKRFANDLQKNGLIKNFETKFRTKDGEIKNGLISAVMIELDNKPHILSITRDITKLKQTEEELAKYRNHLEQLVKDRTQEIDEKNKKLSEQMKIFVGRELKIKELQNKIEKLTNKSST